MFVLIVSVIAIAALMTSAPAQVSTEPTALIIGAPALAVAAAALATTRIARYGPRQRRQPARLAVRARRSTILLSRLRA